MSYKGAWRNRRAPLYTQFCYPHEADPKLLSLIEKYGAAFDDGWHYRLAGRTMKVITRRPLWLDVVETGRVAEKPEPRKPYLDMKLMDFQTEENQLNG